jgi:hypothetical protein
MKTQRPAGSQRRAGKPDQSSSGKPHRRRNSKPRQRRPKKPRPARPWLPLIAPLPSLPLLAPSTLPFLFKGDLGIPTSSNVQGIDKFAQFMASLATPLLIALAAVAPIALIFGAGALMMGNRRALVIIASTVGALALAASATGLVN